MKKVILLFAIILTINCIGCNTQPPKKDYSNTNAKFNVSLENQCTYYNDFLKNNFSPSATNTIEYCLKDLDNNSIPELIILYNGVLIEVYTYTTEVTKIGNYDFKTGTLRLLSSYNKSYPGIIFFYVGGGENVFEYAKIDNNKLIFEKIWVEKYSESPSKIIEFSQDKQLINESKIAYQENNDIQFKNILTMK